MTSDSPAFPANWTPFVHLRPIHWGDTDTARIAYTGRFSDFYLEAVESWFRDRLGTDWYAIALDEDLGTPFVHLEFDFKSPVTPREPLALRVLVTNFGRSSISFAVEARGANTGELRFTGASTSVFVRSSLLKSISIPAKYLGPIRHEHEMAKDLLAAK